MAANAAAPSAASSVVETPAKVVHELLRPSRVQARLYQLSIARRALLDSTLVILPTGLGKTVIAALVALEVLKRGFSGKRKVLMLAPTKPLVEQHARTLRDLLVGPSVIALTGAQGVRQRAAAYADHQVIVATPQVVRNDLSLGRFDLSEFGLLIFDEAHRATGEYAYVEIAASFRAGDGLVLGMTASPGSKRQRILEVCSNLGIRQVEIRSESDADVAPYLQEVEITIIKVGQPAQLAEVIRLLGLLEQAQIESLQRRGVLRPGVHIGLRDLQDAERRVQAKLRAGGAGAASYYHTASVVAQAKSVAALVDRAQTQGRHALEAALGRLAERGRPGGPKYAARLLADPLMQQARAALERCGPEGAPDHPKLLKVVALVEEQLRLDPHSRIIVFTQFRDTAELVTSALVHTPMVKPVRFVGQASRGADKGLTQTEQGALLDDFRAGRCNVLVATSVAEEGLDIPQTDLVVFYEPVPSEIRSIQRRGRTGRQQPGRVVMLVTAETRDEAFHYAAKAKERRMHMELGRLRSLLRENLVVGDPITLPEGQALLGESRWGELAGSVAPSIPPAVGTNGQGAAAEMATFPRPPLHGAILVSRPPSLAPLDPAQRSLQDFGSMTPRPESDGPSSGGDIPAGLVLDEHLYGSPLWYELRRLQVPLKGASLSEGEVQLSPTHRVLIRPLFDLLVLHREGKLSQALQRFALGPSQTTLLLLPSAASHQVGTREVEELCALARALCPFPVVECPSIQAAAQFVGELWRTERQRMRRRI